jgi:hypothetical protein
MFNKRLGLIGFAVGGMTLLATLISNADFVDHFDNGRATDSGAIPDFWSQNNFSGADSGSSITEPVDGPLKLSYTGDPSGEAGPRICSRVSPQFDFFAHPVSLTIAAAPSGTLTPVKPPSTSNDNSRTARAWTFLGLTATSGPGLTDGPNRVVLQLSDRNVLKFSIKDSANKVLYTLGLFDIPPDASVKKMRLYLDGTDEAKGNLFINFGVEYADSNGTLVNHNGFLSPFNLGGTGKSGAGKSQAQLDLFKTGFSGGASAVIELLNISQ